MTDEEIIRVVSAHKEGKKIQFKNEKWGWTDCVNNEPAWEFMSTEYRVAPEPPKPREWTVWVDPMGIISQFGNHSGQGVAKQIKVREVIGASSGNPAVASDTASCNQ